NNSVTQHISESRYPCTPPEENALIISSRQLDEPLKLPHICTYRIEVRIWGADDGPRSSRRIDGGLCAQDELFTKHSVCPVPLVIRRIFLAWWIGSYHAERPTPAFGVLHLAVWG